MHPVHCFVMEKYCLACGDRSKERTLTARGSTEGIGIAAPQIAAEAHHTFTGVASRHQGVEERSCPQQVALPLGILCIMVFGLLTFMALDYCSATSASSSLCAVRKFVAAKVKVEFLV